MKPIWSALMSWFWPHPPDKRPFIDLSLDPAPTRDPDDLFRVNPESDPSTDESDPSTDETVLADLDPPLAALAQSMLPPIGMDCCVFVALWVVRRSHLAAQVPIGATPEKTVATAMKVTGAWWERANIWREADGTVADWWSSVVAAQEYLGGTLSSAVPAHAVMLTPGRVHVLQRWNKTRTDGHTWLAYALLDGDNRCVTYQSSRKFGFRTAPTVGAWTDKGEQYEVMCLTLPATVQVS